MYVGLRFEVRQSLAEIGMRLKHANYRFYGVHTFSYAIREVARGQSLTCEPKMLPSAGQSGSDLQVYESALDRRGFLIGTEGAEDGAIYNPVM